MDSVFTGWVGSLLPAFLEEEATTPTDLLARLPVRAAFGNLTIAPAFAAPGRDLPGRVTAIEP